MAARLNERSATRNSAGRIVCRRRVVAPSGEELPLGAWRSYEPTIGLLDHRDVNGTLASAQPTTWNRKVAALPYGAPATATFRTLSFGLPACPGQNGTSGGGLERRCPMPTDFDKEMIQTGWSVWTADGQELGTIISTDATSLQVKKRGLLGGEVQVPRDSVEDVETGRVELSVTKNELEATKS
jgi:hypothetical protein